MLGKLIDGQLHIASGNILIDGDEITVNPREEDWIRAGYKEIINNPLPEREGYYQVPEYTETEENLIINYHYEEIEDEPME